MDWYRLPIERQCMLPTILINLQEPVELFYFGVNSCSRESMKKVSGGLDSWKLIRENAMILNFPQGL